MMNIMILFRGLLSRSIEEDYKGDNCELVCINPVSNSKECKEYPHLFEIINIAIKSRLPRDGIIVAIGGGVVMDIAGFAAQQYHRMVKYIRVPTTLVGQIDAGIGIKVGINYHENKNLLGSFYPPQQVINCKEFLYDLDKDNFANGISETLKAGIADYFEIVEILSSKSIFFSPETIRTGKTRTLFRQLIDMAISTMLRNISRNLFEDASLMMLMDFGHTFSPIIEDETQYLVPHGFAVAIDMFI